jgi:hypothetical protein
MGSVGQVGLEDEEAEFEETDPALDESEWAAELSRRQHAFKHLKQHHQRKNLERSKMTNSERNQMKAEVLRVLEEDAKRQARFQRQADFPGVGIGYYQDSDGKLIKRKAPRKKSVPRSTPASASAPRKARVRASRPMTEEDQERINRNRDQRHTRFWFARQLAAIFDGELKLSREQYHALLSFGRMRGWLKKRSPTKR